jgi:hypothetical protein
MMEIVSCPNGCTVPPCWPRDHQQERKTSCIVFSCELCVARKATSSLFGKLTVDTWLRREASFLIVDWLDSTKHHTIIDRVEHGSGVVVVGALLSFLLLRGTSMIKIFDRQYGGLEYLNHKPKRFNDLLEFLPRELDRDLAWHLTPVVKQRA